MLAPNKGELQMAEAAVLEEVQPKKKVLVNRKTNTNSERIKKDEEELKTLVEEHKGEAQEKEHELVAQLNEKYGAGQLNPQTGVFTPSPPQETQEIKAEE